MGIPMVTYSQERQESAGNDPSIQTAWLRVITHPYGYVACY